MTPNGIATGRALASVAAMGLGLDAGAAAAQEESFKPGIVTFLSGQAAESFGVPARDAAELLVERLNAGEAPAPYDQEGFGGLPVELVIIDEVGGATTQVQEFRNLVQREGVNSVVGYISSATASRWRP